MAVMVMVVIVMVEDMVIGVGVNMAVIGVEDMADIGVAVMVDTMEIGEEAGTEDFIRIITVTITLVPIIIQVPLITTQILIERIITQIAITMIIIHMTILTIMTLPIMDHLHLDSQ